MNFERIQITAADAHTIPAFLLSADKPRGGALLVPPYGGSKEHMLGLAAALAETGWATLTVDLCGHGENFAEIGPGMAAEVEEGLQYLRRFGTTAAIGLSLGGRLALASSADAIVAISPSVIVEMSPQGKWMFENFPSPGVREPYAGYVIKLLEELGPVRTHDRPCLLLYAERDIPAILDGAQGLKAALSKSELRYVTCSLHPEVQHDNGFIRYLPRWFNHMDLKFNPEVLAVSAGWLNERWGKAQVA